MAATTQVQVFHGAGPTGTDATGTTLRMKRADNDLADADDVVPIPESGYAYSWRKSFRLVALDAPTDRISNLRFWTNGANLGTGRTVLFATSQSYAQASAADEDTPIGGTDAASLTSGAPEVIQAGTVIDEGDTFPSDGGVLQDYVQLQMRVADNALAGVTVNPLQVAYRFDEV